MSAANELESPLGIQKTLDSVNQASFQADSDRIRALEAAYALVSRLETPWDTVARLCMTEPALGASLKVVGDLKLFQRWHDAEDDSPKSTEELAKLTGCEDVFLLSRILRHLVATNVMAEPCPGLFQQTPFSTALLQPVFGEWINYLYDATMPCFHKMPEYLAQTGYKNPADPNDGIFQYTKKFPGGLFEYYNKNAREGQSFNNVMGGVMANQAGMLDICPFEVLQDSHADDDAAHPLLVDVGGNLGHDVEKFRAKHPEVAGRLVLQDLPDVVARTKCPSPVRVMAHDFFEPQPVQGARAYYMHGVLHDWSDEPAQRILAKVKDAMTPGYSKMLIHDHVLPERNPHPQATAYDLTMMVKVSAFERTEGMWKDLLKPVGLKIVKIWDSPLATQSVLEVELP